MIYNSHFNNLAMKWVVFILLLILLADQVSAAGLRQRSQETEDEGNSYFKVFNISPINLYPNSEVNFTVNLKSMGGNGAFAQPIFNTTEGLSAKAPGGMKYIVATGNRTYNCTMRAENITPGNYSFQVGVYAQSAPYSWRTAYLTVEAPMMSIEGQVNRSENAAKSPNANESAVPQSSEAGTKAGKSSPMGMPGPGFILTLVVLIIAVRFTRS